MPDTATLGAFPKTARSRVRRLPKRGHYERETVFSVLDSALHCHVGYVIDGLPYVTPTLFWREGESLYWHGSSASRMLRAQREGIPVCLTVSHVDGLVVARSGFHHSLNYRAVMVFGHAHIVDDPVEKTAKLNSFVERLYPGRNQEIRSILPKELKATMLLGMIIEEVSAKVRTGGPVDDEPDYALDCWAGVIPIVQVLGEPVADERLKEGVASTKGVEHLAKGGRLDETLLALAARNR